MGTVQTFRIFVSSTFSDFKEERNALQKYVFPRLRDLCEQYGFHFQAVDLRWGVSDEAGFDQKTMQICLDEVKRCKETTRRPNFVVLLGDRYGWCPLPAEIPSQEFEEILSHFRNDQAKSRRRRFLLESWYWRDDNAVPPLYCLQPREGKFLNAGRWNITEHLLRVTLLEAIKELWREEDKRRLKYEASATEQEIQAGVLSVEDAYEHVFCYFRKIKDLPQDYTAQDFIDLNMAYQRDNTAQNRLEVLEEKLSRHLTQPGYSSSDAIYEADAQWIGIPQAAITTDHIGNLPDDLDECLHLLDTKNPPRNLCARLWINLARTILEEIQRSSTSTLMEHEANAHDIFGKERKSSFVGRGKDLSVIESYVNSENHHPLVVFGPSGVGKSSLMAQAWEEVKHNYPNTIGVVRFIGATAASSNIRELLGGLCHQISVLYGADETSVPVDYDDLISEFPKLLALAREDNPLIIFLDALDQLSDVDDAQNLNWLPAELPDHVHLIVSTSPGGCLEALEAKLPEANRHVLTGLSRSEGNTLLDKWLSTVGRKLQDYQRQEVLDKFSQDGLPLYLKLAFEEACLWKSYSPPVVLSPSIPSIIHDNLFKRLETNASHGQPLVSRSLSYLAAAKNGLSESELIDVLSGDVVFFRRFKEQLYHRLPEERLPFIVWSRLYADLAPYLRESNSDGVTLLSFYHRQFTEATEEKYLTSRAKTIRHGRLAEYFRRKVDPACDATWESSYPRGLNELPYQLMHGQFWRRLEETLCDLRFIEAKCKAGMLLDLLDDYQSVSAISEKSLASYAKTIETYRRFVRGQGHVLGVHPELTFQQAANYFENDGIQRIALERWEKGIEQRPWLRLIRRQVGSDLPYLSFHTENPPLNAAVSHDGDRIALCDGAVSVYEVQSGRKLLYLPYNANATCTAIAMSSDGSMLACAEYSGSEQASCSLWDINRHMKIGQLVGPFGHILTLRFSPTDDLLAMGGALSKGGVVAVWSLTSYSRIWLHTISGVIVRRVVFSSDGTTLIAAQGDGICSLWQVVKGERIKIIIAHQGAINDLCISPSGDHIATAGQDGLCQVWSPHLKSGTRLQPSFVGFLQGRKKSVAFTAHRVAPTTIAFLNDFQLISGDAGGHSYLWDISGEQSSPFFASEGSILEMELSGSGRCLLALSTEDRTCRFYETVDPPKSSTSYLGQTKYLHFLEHAQELIVGRQGDNEILFLGKNAPNRHALQEISQVEEPVSMAVSRNRRYILTANRSRQWMLWDTEYSNSMSGTFATTLDAGALISVSDNGRWICSFFQEKFERISTDEMRSDTHRLPMLLGAIQQQDDGTIRLVGINMRLQHRSAEEIVVIDLYLDGQLFYWGEFDGDLPRNSSGFHFSDSDTFVRCTQTPDGQGIVDIWHFQGERKARRVFPGAVKIHDFTLDGKWLLLAEPSTSMAYILDTTLPDMPTRWSFPLSEALTCATIQVDGSLIGLGYKQGGIDILQRVLPNASAP